MSKDEINISKKPRACIFMPLYVQFHHPKIYRIYSHFLTSTARPKIAFDWGCIFELRPFSQKDWNLLISQTGGDDNARHRMIDMDMAGWVAGWGELLDMTSLWKNKATYTVWWNGMDRVCRYLPLSIHITSITMWLHVNPSALKEASTSHRDECQRFTWLRRNYTR